MASRTREARSLHQAASQEEERQTRAARKETRAAYLGVISSIDRVKALREALEAQKLVLEAKREGYRSGLYTVLAYGTPSGISTGRAGTMRWRGTTIS